MGARGGTTVTTTDGIRDFAKRKRIQRLCHFTRLSSLPGMIKDRCIKPSDQLRPEQIVDSERFDQLPDHVCCSIMFPNVFLLNKHVNKHATDVSDWCVLLLKRTLLWQQGAKFCPVNAATKSGEFVKPGLAGLESLYNKEVRQGNKFLKRGPCQPDSVPTDNQAEVLIPGGVDLAAVREGSLRSRPRPKRLSGANSAPSNCRRSCLTMTIASAWRPHFSHPRFSWTATSAHNCRSSTETVTGGM